MILEPHLVGQKDFQGVVDVTDPCYDKDVWCRINGVQIKPGIYNCVAWTGKDDDWGRRCWIAGIYHADETRPFNQFFKKNNESVEEIGEIGVDAGLAGFFHDKPDYNDEEWSRFCDDIFNGDAWIKDEGFFTSSGCGDGGYSVLAEKNNDGEIIAMEIHF